MNNNNHNDNNNQGIGNNTIESKRVIQPDDATKSTGMDMEATAIKSTTTTGVGSNDTGVMEQGKWIK